MASVFANAIEFLNSIGLYDIVLPFLLTFTIVFAIFEKTKILGVDKINKVEYTKKNLNSLVAFCVAFFVIASSQIVQILNTALAQVVILLIVVVFYMILIGVFFENGENVFFDKKSPWRTGFMVALLIGILLIFLNAIPVGKTTAIGYAYEFLKLNISTGFVSAIILLVFIALVMGFVMSDNKPKKKNRDDD